MRSFAAKCRDTPWLVFALVLAWKLGLFLVSTQPVPSNDAFFYDGAVVNQRLHGGYFNPSLALALPISGTRVFSAYPPLYQGTLWVWMSLFGTSAPSAMALHLLLFAGYVFVVYRILQQLQTPAGCFHLAGAFLLVLTFHDRPDSLAHLLGMSAVYFWVRSRRVLNGANAVSRPNFQLALMVLFVVLTLCTSLQIGAVYLFLLWLGMAITRLAGREHFPVMAMTATLILPAALAAAVKFGFPGWWAGFLEHARGTPSWTGLQFPDAGAVLKVVRTVPAICLMVLVVPWSWFKQWNHVPHAQYARYEVVLLAGLLAALGVVGACLLVITPNAVIIAGYLQPVVVACYLAFCGSLFAGQRWLRFQVVCLCLAAALGSIRAVGMSTWGIACARDVSYQAAIQRVDRNLAGLPAGTKVVVSSAFLYQAATHRDLTLIHSDWLHPTRTVPRVTDLQGLLALKPAKIILTQFDYYRRYQAVLEELQTNPALLRMTRTNTAKILPPDANPRLQRVLQHISWAPVLVDLSWRN
jgi:hypothetical protein